MSDSKNSALFSDAQLRKVETALDIRANHGTIDNAIFQHSILCQTFIPRINPGDGVDIWKRQQGNATLLLQALKVTDRKTNQEITPGLPYGVNARLILTHANTQAIKTKNPVIPLGDNMSRLLEALKKNSKDGRTRNGVENQLHRLMGTHISMTFLEDSANGTRERGSKLQLISDYDLWYPKAEGDQFLFPSLIRLDDRYFENLMNHAVPLDERAVYSLIPDAMALDIYTWMAHRLHQIPHGKPLKITWVAMKEQFGQEIVRMDHFKEKFRAGLKKVLLQYPGARIAEEYNKFFTLQNSPPPISKLMISVNNPLK